MDYLKHYRNLIETRQKLNRTRKDGIYYEKHHIIPKCLGGSNKIENLILLTAKEHFIAHLLLHKIRPHSKKLAYSLWCLCTMSNGYKIKSARLFEYLRKNVLGDMNPSKNPINRKKSSIRMKKNNPSTINGSPNKGVNVKELYGSKISAGLIDYYNENGHHLKGIKKTMQHKENMSKTNHLNKAIIINGIIYVSINEASRQLNISHSILRNQLSGKTSNVMGIKYK